MFLPTLSSLTERRIAAKRELERSTGRQRAYWQGLQSSLKVLINSFYGYLGYSRGFFNDFDAAEKVTLRGQAIIRSIVDELERHGATVIEIDTDGVLLQPPASVDSIPAEQALVDAINAALPRGITLALDGRYRGMLSLRLKNYALLAYDGTVVMKGSSLRSRREEPILRAFLADAVARFLEPHAHGDVREFYLDTAERLRTSDLPPDMVARTETITEKTRNTAAGKRLAEAVEGERIGERVQVYQRGDGTVARIEEYASDPDRAYLLRRLREMAARFRPLFSSDDDFNYTFPPVTLETSIDVLRSTPQSQQLSLFEA